MNKKDLKAKGRNPGKIFEDDFRDSVPKDAYYLRLHDSSIGFDIKKSTQRFALKSPYDAIICKNGKMYCFELKSTNGSSFSFLGKAPLIKPHQIKELDKAHKAGAIAGLVLNFRKYNETYYIDIKDFLKFQNETDKKSVNIKEARVIGRIVPQQIKKVHYRYDVASLLI